MLRSVLCAVAVACFLTPVMAQEDLRVRYGTDDIQAAKEIHRGIGLASANKHKEALAAFEAAIKADSNCGMALFQKGIALGDMGEVEQSVATFKGLFAPNVKSGRNLRATAATNVGLTLGKLGEFDESNLWFSRGIVEDYDNEFKERGKAYRNMALNLRGQKKHLPAAVAMALAYQDKARNCDMAAVRDFFNKVEEADDSCRLLTFDDPIVAAKKRAEPVTLTELTIAGKPTDAITDFLADPAGKYIIALCPTVGKYHIINTGDTPDVKTIEAKGLVSGCLMGGKLFLSRIDPNRVDEVAIQTGEVVKAYAFPKLAPRSFTVFPVQNRIYYSQNDTIHEYDMTTGQSRETNTPGTMITGHPNQKYVYSFFRPQRGGGSGLVVVDGRVLEVQQRGFNWMQCPLFKSLVTPAGLLLAEIRDNAAANGQRLVVSADGNWVGIAGGGGYRPSDKTAGGGYGVAIFNAMNTEKPQGFYKTDAYPLGLSINSVTGAVVAVRKGDINLYDLAAPGTSIQTIKGDWNGACAWTGDGKTLVLGQAKGGFQAYQTQLTKDEEKLATEWQAKITVTPIIGKPRPATATAMADLKTFAVPETPTIETVHAAIDKAVAKGRSIVLPHWAGHPDYEKNKAAAEEISKTIQFLQGGRAEEIGIALVRLKRVDKATPNFPPILFFMGELNARRNQREEAEKFFLSAIHEDAGKSDITILAFTGLAILFEKNDQPLKSLYCLAAALETDRANPKIITRTADLLVKSKMSTDAVRVRNLAIATAPNIDAGTPTAVVGLPMLQFAKEVKKLTAEELYARSVSSVVMIRTRDGSGSGVCIGRGDIIITNAHVVEQNDDVDVFTYKFDEKKLTRNPAIRGKVLYRSDTADLAIVQLPKPVLTPLPVGPDSPRAGAKVLAVGSPGLGKDVLEQSISEGLVSSPTRRLDGKVYIQHSAAVNPGNSGGPLFDESGRVIGIVTLKARLENVGFAVPVETFRKLFPAEAK